MRTFILFVVLVALFDPSREETEEDSLSVEVYKSMFDKVMIALKRVINFFETGFLEVNMDGLYGIRICQGNLIGTLEDCSHYKHKCDQTLINTIQEIIDRIEKFGEYALPNIKQQDDDYYNNYLPSINASCIVGYIPERLLGGGEVVNASLVYDGEMGNRCFGNIMGTRKVDGRNIPKCTITDSCWQFLSVEGTIGYYTTHQLLYRIYGEQVGCKKELEDRTQKDFGITLREHEKLLCEQIFIDANYREENGIVPVNEEDLFLEQIALCGMLGFKDFLSLNWMRMVLSWQTERGCFTVPSFLIELDEATQRRGYTVYKLYKHLHENGDKMSKTTRDVLMERIAALRKERDILLNIASIKYYLYNSARGSVKTRKLMSELVMGGDCLSHKSGLGAAVLGVYTRYLAGKLFDSN